MIQTKWGKIVDHEDFYVDTGRIADLDGTLTERGVAPIAKVTP